MFHLSGTLPAVTCALLFGITSLAVVCDLAEGSSDFSGYLSKVLKNYTEQACDGDLLSVRCPPRTTITVQSAFYGRKGVSDVHRCPQTYQAFLGYFDAREDEYCSVSTALQKMLDECQDRRSCQVLVNSRVFGMDQCPGSSKYLTVWYKCRPIPKKLLQEQSSRPPVYSSPNNAHDPNIVGDSPPQGTSVKRPDTVPDRKRTRETSGNQERYPEVDREGGGETPSLRPPEINPIINSTSGSSMALISNALAAYTYVSNHPERAALFFVCGVCLGLFLTLFALVVQISCRTDCQPRQRPPAKKRTRPADSSSDSSDSDSDWDTTSDLSARRHRRFERTLNMNVFTSAEELERAQRLEERERIIREIWMNGQPDVPGTRSLNRYY
ncbi:protein eva-1 homolog C isoform X2 [Nerophis lumbriciformis]|uniref:protein eva-1 homolog C isoform X2 n=1 Tax=Nerophis lumbriciformis TaxID=546530 RepID=UPI002ADF7CC2|nr:protein eva-1 homolog C-like isoform X2 [Nerophis lumbriciformis]